MGVSFGGDVALQVLLLPTMYDYPWQGDDGGGGGDDFRISSVKAHELDFRIEER